MNIPSLIITPRRAAMRAGADNTVDVLVRVRGPELPAGELPARGPLHLSLVIDRSGSMSGAPLAEAKRCAAYVVGGLAPGDSASLVVYDDGVDTLAPLTPAGSRAGLAAAIGRIRSGGSTNLHGGWLQGAETLAPHTAPKVISRVILLSDGCANAGVTEPDAIHRQCAALAEAGVTTSTYGLGENFNEDLMIGMARAGLGNSYYGATAEDLMGPFREELSLLNALCATRVQLHIELSVGVGATVLNGYPAAGIGAWQLPDLAFGGDVWAVVRLNVPRGAIVPDTATPLCAFSVRYVDRAGEPRAVMASALALPVVDEAAFDALAEDADVIQRIRELEAAQAQEEARAAARRGDWEDVRARLAGLAALCVGDEMLGGLKDELDQLAARRDAAMFSKESAYASGYLRRRIHASMPQTPNAAEPQAEFLRRKRAMGRRRPSQP